MAKIRTSVLLFVGLRTLCAISICCWVGSHSPTAFALSSHAIIESPLVEKFREASAAFASNRYSDSQRLFHDCALLCPGSELAIQCQFFESVSAWNLDPSPNHAQQIEQWLENVHRWQIEKKRNDDVAPNKSINGWIETAHLLLCKAAISKGDLESAKNRLLELSRVCSNASDETIPGLRDNFPPAQSKDSDKSPISFEQQAWPSKTYSLKPNTWLQLGFLELQTKPEAGMIRANPLRDRQLANAANCFRNAMKYCDRDPLIESQSRWGMANTQFELAEFDDCEKTLDELDSNSIDDELKIKSAMLRVKLLSVAKRSTEIGRTLQPVFNLATTGNFSAQLLYELALTLAENGMSDQSNEIWLKIVNTFPESPLAIEALVRIGRYNAERDHWQTAREYCNRAVEKGCPDTFSGLAHYLIGKSYLKENQLDRGLPELELALQLGGLEVDVEIAIHFDLGETLYQNESWDKSLAHWNWLYRESQKQTQKPEWLATVLIRQSELLANQQDWTAVEKNVSEIRRDFPQWQQAPEVDYLIARCCIANAEFDRSREILSALMSSPNVPANLAARAGWIMGETFMMQRRYAEAAQSYQRVLAISDQSYWHAGSLLQLGQCAELSQDWNKAIQWYRELQSTYPDTPFANTAKERMDEATARSNQQAKRFGSGTKR